MATIAVRVGEEIKEISGLTKSTKCSDVVLALLKEKVVSDMSESSTGANENVNSGDQGVTEPAPMSKSIKELAPSYVIVENWRGCEKPIPPRTRILNVWQAWGKEQKHVELSLKKSKNIRFRDGSHHAARNRGGTQSERNDADPDHSSLHNMSSHQKRKIRRNMRQYHRALIMKQSENCGVESEELNLQNDKSEVKPDSKIEKRNMLITSEETFIDGFLADPDCLIRRADRARLIDQGTFNREFCKYRRRNRRRHGASNSRQHRRHQVSHYPYSSQHDKPRSSRKGMNTKSRKCRYSSDDSSASSMSNSSEDENASDADDEKSILVDMRSNTPRRNVAYNIGMRGDNYSATTGTDSSTTTSGDSLISSLGGSTSSETSSGGDYFLPELPARLSYVKAMDDAKVIKATQNSSNKPKKNKFILKPALNLIESFRKPSKRKSNKKSIEKLPSIPDVKSNPATKIVESAPTPKNSTNRKNSDSDAPVKRNESEQTESNVTVKKATEQPSPVQNTDSKELKNTSTVEDDSEEHERKDEILQSIQSQEIVLKNQRNRLMETDSQIQNIENDIHSLRTRALGKNYVQDAYLSGFVDPNSNGAMTSLFNGPSIPVTTSWIVDCEDVDMLEHFIKLSEDIVKMQLKIAEYTRKSESILQDMQEEMWQLSTITDSKGQGRSTATKGAVMMLGISDEEDFSEDDDGHELLSVTNWQDSATNIASPQKVNAQSRYTQLEAARADLEESLYLSQQLAEEVIEIDGDLGTSDDSIQKKCEVLIDCFRELAMSEEGVPQEMWEEYGEFLPPYDATATKTQSPREIECSEMSISNMDTSMVTEVKTYIDATSPNPTSHCGDENHTMIPHQVLPMPFHEGLNFQARAEVAPLPPWTHCDHCKIERAYNGHVNAMRNHTVMQQPHISNYAQQPPIFSQLPLPTPINNKLHCNNHSQVRAPSTISSSLLPMLPIPGELMSPDHHNDSDYEDLPDLTSMGPPDPSKSSRQIGLLEETEIYNNTDDSGNASAGSTTSFTSSDGSRNSSCDGGSPRPIPTLVDNPGLKPIFGRNSRLRGSLKGHFIFPNTFKQNNAHSDQRFQATPLSTPTSKPKFKKPELLPKPAGLTFKNATVVDSKETEIMMQQQRLIRRNSTGKRKNGMDDANSLTTRDSLNNKPTKLKNVSSGFIHSKESYNQGWNRTQTKLYGNEPNQRFINNYDNDSDTGRSSLHSVDSDQVMFSETLV